MRKQQRHLWNSSAHGFVFFNVLWIEGNRFFCLFPKRRNFSLDNLMVFSCLNSKFLALGLDHFGRLGRNEKVLTYCVEAHFTVLESYPEKFIYWMATSSKYESMSIGETCLVRSKSRKILISFVPELATTIFKSMSIVFQRTYEKRGE